MVMIFSTTSPVASRVFVTMEVSEDCLKLMAFSSRRPLCSVILTRLRIADSCVPVVWISFSRISTSS